MYEHSFSDGKVNICSQTDESWCHFLAPPQDPKVNTLMTTVVFKLLALSGQVDIDLNFFFCFLSLRVR
jgi:hypothetical protein